MATSTIKSNVQRGNLTVLSPFDLRSWGSATYVRVGSLAILNIYAAVFSSEVSANTPVVDLPFYAKGRQSAVITAQDGTKVLFFVGDGQTKLYVDGAAASSTYYFQFIVDTY